MRDGGAPAAAPAALVVEDVHFARGDDGGCCGSRGDTLELRERFPMPQFGFVLGAAWL